jgi:hypothetical protein
MKLRNHPQITRKNGFRPWPPIWTTTRHDKDDKPIGEVGSLEDVMMSELIDNKVFMFMQHEGYDIWVSCALITPKSALKFIFF